jgi:hypothetical protein
MMNEQERRQLLLATEAGRRILRAEGSTIDPERRRLLELTDAGRRILAAEQAGAAAGIEVVQAPAGASEVPQPVAVGGDAFAIARPAGVSTITRHPRVSAPGVTVLPPVPDHRALELDEPGGPAPTFRGFGRQVGG